MSNISFKKVEGTVKDLGDSIAVKLMNVYTYIEMADGQILRYVAIIPTLHGKFVQAVRSGEKFEMHFNVNPDGKAFKMALLAVKVGDRTYTCNSDGAANKILLISLLFAIMGIFTIFFLVGLVPLYFSYKAFSAYRIAKRTERYLKNLPDAIYL